jgi:cytochrome c2
MKKAICALLAALFAGSASLFPMSHAQADPAFKKGFETLYVKTDSTDPKDVALAEAVKKAKCNICHMGKSKKMRNAYGEELAQLLDRKKDRKDTAKIEEAIKKVGEMKSDKNNESSPTFAELIAQGRLPVEEEESN